MVAAVTPDKDAFPGFIVAGNEVVFRPEIINRKLADWASIVIRHRERERVRVVNNVDGD